MNNENISTVTIIVPTIIVDYLSANAVDYSNMVCDRVSVCWIYSNYLVIVEFVYLLVVVIFIGSFYRSAYIVYHYICIGVVVVYASVQ